MIKEQMSTTVETCRDMLKTEEAIFFIKDFFGKKLAANLNLVNVSAPIAVLDGTGINDDLNGVEKPVSFSVKGIRDQNAVIVQSLAKWKRIRLKEYNIEAGKGLLTDMRAIRPSEELSPIHSVYVDQWDWEKRISPSQRNLDFLKKTVKAIYQALRATEMALFKRHPEFVPFLPENICFIHAEELLRQFPDLTPKQREYEISKIFGAVFIIGIGATLSNGEPHDGRAPDYDDWSSTNEDGYKGLNGDIIVWNPVLEKGFELSSMGIRVNEEAMERQLLIQGCTERRKLLFHRMLLNHELPLSIGGGVGQSRVCMLFLRKKHIGEVQSSIWPESVRNNGGSLRLL